MKKSKRKNFAPLYQKVTLLGRLMCLFCIVIFPILIIVSCFVDGAKNLYLWEIKEAFLSIVAGAFLPWED